ncbi:MAG: Putative von Willebrand factor, vWF type A domain protein STM2315, partial [uncultured Gemmatimonadaceae bacterium]
TLRGANGIATRAATGAAPGAAPAAGRPSSGAPRADPEYNTEAYARIYENPFASPRVAPLSTFSIDVDHAAYANVRRFIAEGRRPPADAVRVEELLNYFTYDNPAPAGDAPFSVTSEVGRAPWSPGHQLVRIALQARRIPTEALPPSNLVFLIDVSGSMAPPDKLPLVKQAFRLLVNELRPQDRVAIVVYAGAAGLVLPSTPGSEKARILAALDRLEAGGSTAGGAGLRLAYDVARAHQRRGVNSRVVLATDGDFNVGESSDAAMVRLVEQRRDEGTALTVLGVGTGNLKDAKMEQLADKGNGNYAYLDNLLEAQKALVQEMGGTLVTVAKDVKLQVEFNPRRVAGYRLIGYENRALRDEDFNDDAKDAGELGAGHAVTALYELIP